MVGICFTHFTENNRPPICLCSTLQTANLRKSKHLRATFFNFSWFAILRNRCKYLFINNYPCFLESLIFSFQILCKTFCLKQITLLLLQGKNGLWLLTLRTASLHPRAESPKELSSGQSVSVAPSEWYLIIVAIKGQKRSVFLRFLRCFLTFAVGNSITKNFFGLIILLPRRGNGITMGR